MKLLQRRTGRSRVRPQHSACVAEKLEDRYLLTVVNPENTLAGIVPHDFVHPAFTDLIAAERESINVASEPLKSQSLLSTDADGNPVARIRTTEFGASFLQSVTDLGNTVIAAAPQYGMVDATLNLASLSQLTALTGVYSITPVYRPLALAGSVQTQGDAVLNADDVRVLGYDGTNVRVGVLSDSAYSIADSQATGDLPAVVDRYLEFPDGGEPAYDEGRAMLEIVHDIAPGAELAHHSAYPSELSFAQGIRELAASGAQVIVDDIIYFTEPFFQDGIVAQAVNDVVNGGSVFVSAAGNSRNLAYESAWTDGDGGSTETGLHDFDPGPGVDTRQQITVPAGFVVKLNLQWDDPFYTATGVTHDFEVRVFDSGGNPVSDRDGAPEADNVATQEPIEIFSWDSSGDGIYQIEIERQSGDGPSRLKYVLHTSEDASIDEFDTASGTIYGHAAAAGAISVGAVPYFDPDTAEPFSSYGDVTIYFDADGTRLGTPVSRSKPDVVAPDGVNTTFFGGATADIPEDADTFPNFFGTSASAPHVAGVAALLLDANPNLTTTELYAALTTTAVDLGATGFDELYGFGRVDAEAAVNAALAVSDVTRPTAELLSPIATHGWDVSTLKVRYSEPMDAATVANSANYTLTGAGVDGLFGTGDDVLYSTGIVYDGLRNVTLTVTSPAAVLDDGKYRQSLNSSVLDDPSDNLLDDATNQFEFEVARRSEIVTLEGGVDFAMRPDGSSVFVYPDNPSLSGLAWPQVMIGTTDAGADVAGPFRSAPTNMEDAFRVESPRVALNATHGVVVYEDKIERGGGGFLPLYALTFQFIDLNGRPVGDREVAIYYERRDSSGNSPKQPHVSMNASGQFMVVGSAVDDDSGSYKHRAVARLYDADGTPLTDAFFLSDDYGSDDARVALMNDGSSIFVWRVHSGLTSSGDGPAIMGRRFDANGIPLGPAFPVSSTYHGYKGDAAIAAAADGSFAVAWNSYGASLAPTVDPVVNPQHGVFLQRFDAAANRIGTEYRVAGAVSFYNTTALVDTPDGRLVAVWPQTDDDGEGIFAQRMSADGVPVGLPLWVNQGMSVGDQNSVAADILDDGRFVVRWTDDGGETRVRWFSWDDDQQSVPFGPFVRQVSPTALDTGNISQVEIIFDRPMDTATFSLADDVQLFDPAGRKITPDSLTTSDGITFQISFPSQTLRGEYRLVVGPNVTSVGGQLMDQDGDTVLGEVSQDIFYGSVMLRPDVSAAFPLLEDFESGSIDNLGPEWSFSARAAVDVVSTGTPHSGLHQLFFDQTSQAGKADWAMVVMDLSAQSGNTDLWLDFWLRSSTTSSNNYLELQASGDGKEWLAIQNISTGNSVQHSTQFVYDLDTALAAAGIALDNDVYLRLSHDTNGTSSTYDIWVDDFRVGASDVMGPTVVSQTPLGSYAGELTSISLEFSEVIDASTFTAADVQVIGSGNTPLPLTGDPVDSGDGRTFTVTLQESQFVSGVYQVLVGPEIQDVAGNLMNQDGDYLQGEPQIGNSFQDVYRGVIDVQWNTGVSYPYFQSFDSISGVGSEWEFKTSTPSFGVGGLTFGRIQIVEDDGRSVVRMDDQYSSNSIRSLNEATLSIDLTGQSSVVLMYDEKTRDIVHAQDGVFISDDQGTTWHKIAAHHTDRDVWVRQTIDLDAAITAAGISYNSDFRISFRQYDSHDWQFLGWELDNVRVTSSHLDFGDAPATYRTLLVDGGAGHFPSGPGLGDLRDTETDGVPHATAQGDDQADSNDEDGLITISPLHPGLPASITVRTPGGGLLDAWIDFNANGMFDDPAEHLGNGTSFVMNSGDNSVSFDVPLNSSTGNTFLRLRVSTAGSLAPNELANDGEVEDHLIQIDPVSFSVTESGGQTTVSENGATDTFDVVLNAAPLTDVVLTVTSGDTEEATVDQATLTFTPANWNTAQTVTVTGADELIVDGDQTTLVTLSVDDPNSDDAFDGLPDQTVSVTTTDDDGSFLDVDDNATADAATDGILIIRYLFGFRGAPLISGAIAGNATRTTAAEVEAALDNSLATLDADGNGVRDAATDGILIIRYLFGFRNEALIAGAVGSGAIRTTGPQVAAFLDGFLPPPPVPPAASTVRSVVSKGIDDNSRGSASFFLLKDEDLSLFPQEDAPPPQFEESETAALDDTFEVSNDWLSQLNL